MAIRLGVASGRATRVDGRNTRTRRQALYTVALDGAPVITTSLPSSKGKEAIRVREFSWAASGAAIYFELSVKFVSNLWRLDMDAGTLKAGSLVQLTAGAGQDTRMAVSRDGRKMAFTTKAESIRIWSYRLDPVTGRDHRLCGAGDRRNDGRARARSPRARRPSTRLCHHRGGDGTVGVVDHGFGDRTKTRSCPVTIMIASTRSGLVTAAAWCTSGDAGWRAAPHLGGPTAQSLFVQCPAVTRRCCPHRDSRTCSPTTGLRTGTPSS